MECLKAQCWDQSCFIMYVNFLLRVAGNVKGKCFADSFYCGGKTAEEATATPNLDLDVILKAFSSRLLSAE